jgi:hypothetical protein
MEDDRSRSQLEASSPIEVFDMLTHSVDEQLGKWKAIVATDVAAYNNLVKQQEVPCYGDSASAMILDRPVSITSKTGQREQRLGFSRPG